MEFNKNVHKTDEHGDGERKEDGDFKLRTNWIDEATDRQNRHFNEKIHIKALDEGGFLKLRPRGKSKLVTSTNRTKSFVAKYKEKGYAYYVMNDEGGRMQQFLDNDWEPVTDKQGAAKIAVGQARDGGTHAVLMRKPEEWYEDDQREKRAMNDQKLKDISSPNEDLGQFEANASSPLR